MFNEYSDGFPLQNYEKIYNYANSFSKTCFLRTQSCKKNYSSMEETAKNKEIHRDDDAIDG